MLWMGSVKVVLVALKGSVGEDSAPQSVMHARVLQVVDPEAQLIIYLLHKLPSFSVLLIAHLVDDTESESPHLVLSSRQSESIEVVQRNVSAIPGYSKPPKICA